MWVIVYIVGEDLLLVCLVVCIDVLGIVCKLVLVDVLFDMICLVVDGYVVMLTEWVVVIDFDFGFVDI